MARFRVEIFYKDRKSTVSTDHNDYLDARSRASDYVDVKNVKAVYINGVRFERYKNYWEL